MKTIKHSLLLFFLLVSLSSVSLSQETFNAKVIGVVDGDTITVLTKEKRQLMLRLAEIDAPEKQQDFGVNAHQFLSNLVLDQMVIVSNVKKDCLDRLTASVSFNKKDLSLLAVKSGNAWADSTCQINELLVREESLAREKKFGLWEGINVVKPSDFLKAKQPVRQAEVNQTGNRRIFTGLAPTPPPILTSSGKPSGLYVGMSLEDFIGICGKSGEKSKTFTTEFSQSFSIDNPSTKENSGKGCGGSFNFRRTTDNPVFKLDSVSQ